MRPLRNISFLIIWAAAAATAVAAPQYQIFDLGALQENDRSGASSVSPGGIVVGGSGTGNGGQAFTWTQGGGLVALPLLSGRSSSAAFSANDNGTVVGRAFNENLGDVGVPVIWQNGVASQLPLPSGFTVGYARAVNASGIAVGSAGEGGEWAFAAIYSVGGSSIITAPAPQGSQFETAYGINDSGRIVGIGFLPSNPIIQLGIVYDMPTNTIFDVGTLPGANSTVALAVSNNGQVVGTSGFQPSSGGQPFIWTEGIGMVAIPLLPGTDRGDAQGVNSAGWVVGIDRLVNTGYAPFLYDGTTTYRLADLLPPGSGWALQYSSGINDNGVIVGSGVHNGNTRAFAMVPLSGTPTPTPTGTPSPSPTSTPTPTPGTPSPTPTPPPPTPTITPGQCGYVFLQENFDGVTAPALPPGWVSSFTPGPANCTPAGTCALGTDWTTSTTNPHSPPNSAFHDAPSCVTDSSLYSPLFFYAMSGAILFVSHSYDLESGLDGAVLEISINRGPFVDFVAAGGSFVGNSGYNGTISSGTQSPLAGRAAWTGNSGGLSGFNAHMPPAAVQQTVVLRFRLATDCSGASKGWRVDNISLHLLVPCNTPTIPPQPTPTPSPTPPTQALNLSTRLRVQTGDNAGIGGFIITGNAPKRLLFRGIGPSLTALGIAGALANPTLDLRRPDGTRILANNDWRETQETEIQATGIPPSDNLEAAIVQTLDPGSYTIILRGMGMTTGIGLVEIYDLDQGVGSKLANISTRAFVETGANIVIAGFIVGGTSGGDIIIVRGIGPSLTGLGISNALADPTLELRDGNGTLLRANNNWQDDLAQAGELSAAGLAPSNPLESGIAMTLSPGTYTALLAGLNNGTGAGLVEVYDLGPP